jgi:hypothetical protein
MAESEGFEPPIALRRCLISSQVHSTGLCQLSVCVHFTAVFCRRYFPSSIRRVKWKSLWLSKELMPLVLERLPFNSAQIS